MRAPTFRILQGQEYQDIAEQADTTTCKLLEGMHSLTAARTGSRDAGPILTGALSGVITFIMMAGYDEARVREIFGQVLETVPKQIELARSAQAARATKAGNA